MLATTKSGAFWPPFVIVHFDFQSGEASRDAANVADRLKGMLFPANRAQASRIWDHLIAKAGELIPVGGGATRATLIQQLTGHGFDLSPAPSFWQDIAALQRDSDRALGDIKSTISTAYGFTEPTLTRGCVRPWRAVNLSRLMANRARENPHC